MDYKKKISISLTSFFQIVKECFVKEGHSLIFYGHYFEYEPNYESIKKFLESKEIAKENFAQFSLWIHDQMKDPLFEKSMYKMLSIRC